MPVYFGIIFAFVALFSWGFGDFFIQRTTRLVGSWKAIFYIAFTGAVVLFPFVKNDILDLSKPDLFLLLLLSLITIGTAFVNFEALKRGKIAIVAPLVAIELPLTVALSVLIIGERLNFIQVMLIALVLAGIVLAATISRPHWWRRRVLEKGAILAGIAAVGLALTNFLVGTASQRISPLMAIWFSHTFIAVICLVYFLAAGNFKSIIEDFKKHPKTIISQSIFDNLAWLSFGAAATLIPISVAITIGEGYVVLSILLGLIFNKEKLKRHQKAGVFLAAVGVIVLAALT